MAQIYSKQIVFSGSMFIEDDGYFYGGRLPQLGNEYVIKDYVDSLVSGSVANSGSFYSLIDTPSVATDGRILFERPTNLVSDSNNLRFTTDNHLLLNGIFGLSTGVSFSSPVSDSTSEFGYFKETITSEERTRESISVSYTDKVTMKMKLENDDEVIMFSRYV